MTLNEESPEQHMSVREHLQQVLGRLEQPTQEETLLFQQVSSPPYHPTGTAPTKPPIQGVLLSHLLQNLPEEGLPATLIYAIFHRLLTTISTLHKHSVFQNAITANKVVICIPDGYNPPSSFRARDLNIHLLIFPTSSLSPPPITPQQSVPDTAAIVKLMYGLTQRHTYFIHKAIDEALWAPINNPVVDSGPPYVAVLAYDLKRKMSYPGTLDNAREMWGDYLMAMLGFVRGLRGDRLREIWHVAMHSGIEVLPMWLAEVIKKGSKVEEISRAAGHM